MLFESAAKIINAGKAAKFAYFRDGVFMCPEQFQSIVQAETGLYKKLISLLDQSPSLFIRNIRLQKASQLIIEQKHSITEIAEIVGFNSSSYFSKCFYEMYQCKPSEYAEKMQKST